MHTSATTHLPWSSSPPNLRPRSAAYWRPPTATGLNRPDPPRESRPSPWHFPAPGRGYKSMWRRAQDEARYVVKVEQDRLDKLFANETESLKRAEEALAHRQSRRSRDDAEYDERLLADEERRVHLERNRVVKLKEDNTEWLSHLIKQETDRIHAAMIEDELEGRLTAEESAQLEKNIQKRKVEEERQSMRQAQEEEARRLRKLEEEEEAAKIRAVQAEELAQGARKERLALPPIPDPEESSSVNSDPFLLYDAPNTDARSQEKNRRLSVASGTSVTSSQKTSTNSTSQASHSTHIGSPISDGRSRQVNGRRHEASSRESLLSPLMRTVSPLQRRISDDSSAVQYAEASRGSTMPGAGSGAQDPRPATKASQEENRAPTQGNRKKAERRKKAKVQAEIDPWDRYERGWQELLNRDEASNKQKLQFGDIPWPTSIPTSSLQALHFQPIREFFLNPNYSISQTSKEKLSNARTRWHPDTFAELLRKRIKKAHWPAVLAGINLVTHVIKLLVNELDVGPPENEKPAL